MIVDDELVDRINVWHFYYFAAASIVSLLEDFLDVAGFESIDGKHLVDHNLPEEYVSADDFSKMISRINLLVRYYNEGGLVYKGKDINLEHGDRIDELTDALHRFANLLPYLNDRHFNMSEERYERAPTGRHCDFNELCNLDKTIARRIFPTLQAFAAMSIFPPRYFMRMFSAYPMQDSARVDEQYDLSQEWGKALASMVESWQWILERKPAVNKDGFEDLPEKVYYGLHWCPKKVVNNWLYIIIIQIVLLNFSARYI